MISVRIGAEADREAPAATLVDLAEESADILLLAAPACLDRDPAPVGEKEGGDIDRIGEAMLAHPRAGPAVDRATGISSERLDPAHRRAEMASRRGLDRLPHPASEGAVERLESHVPAWPLPKIFRMTKGGKLVEGLFRGETINTPSMLAVEDYIWALEWAELQGGLHALIARADANAAALDSWVERTPWIDHLAADPATRSNTSVCLKFADSIAAELDEDGQRALAKKIDSLLEAEGAAFDVAGYRDAPPGIRIWCGATVETDDIEALGPWLDWAFHEARAS